ncbi:MAG: hypothetical protein WCH39_00020 [Schlesneria sp.]
MDNLNELFESLGYSRAELSEADLAPHVRDVLFLLLKLQRDRISVDREWKEFLDRKLASYRKSKDFHNPKDDEAFRLFSEDEIRF